MPKLKPDIQRARREHILEAAERCFANTGFHRTTMHDICKEAAVSPGALYVYFDSKEALIAGIAGRDRAEFADRLAALSDAPDFLKALETLGEHYFIEEPAYRRRMCIEIGLESTRNPRVGEIFQEVDRFVASGFEQLFARLKAEGRIAPELDIPTVAKLFLLIGDGLFWRRATDPAFDGKLMVPPALKLLAKLLNPVPASTPAEAPTADVKRGSAT
ncbi:MAG TPA: TetR/AcrR family transcriptional regulator [Hyphomicrobiaceae bacterium]|nr:TetR/AcrR family transcriptional regulator [Hyphomicrobiaceae bacterium]